MRRANRIVSRIGGMKVLSKKRHPRGHRRWEGLAHIDWVRRRPRALDLDRRHADPITLLQKLILASGLAIDPDQKVFRLPPWQALAEEFRYRGPGLDLNVVRKTAAIVVDEQNAHGQAP